MIFLQFVQISQFDGDDSVVVAPTILLCSSWRWVVVVGNCLATPIFIQQMNNLNLKLKPNKQTLEIKLG